MRGVSSGSSVEASHAPLEMLATKKVMLAGTMALLATKKAELAGTMAQLATKKAMLAASMEAAPASPLMLPAVPLFAARVEPSASRRYKAKEEGRGRGSREVE